MGKRIIEFVLGLIGGIFGIIGPLIALAIGSFGTQVMHDASSATISYLGWLAIVFSILGIVGSVVVRHKPRLGGVFMLVSAIGGVISISFFYALSFVLLLIAGLMGLLMKDKKNERK